jgi:hypothetical protein
MELRRIVLVRWHLLIQADLDVSGDIAILGQNRSGKSTLIDLIQTVLTGGSGAYYRFNKSAGEGGSRSERTLLGYCLAQLNEEVFLRTDGWTHIGLVFEDSEGKRAPLSLGLAIEASRTHGHDVAGRYIAEGIRLESEMFLEETGEGPRPLAWPALRQRLQDACAAGGRDLVVPDSARNFIREYMRRMFTARRTPEPERFVRAFVLALSFADLTSVEEFVRRHLLEKHDIDIGELRESIQRYREIQKTIHELRKRLEALRRLSGLIGEFKKQLEEEDVAHRLERLAQLIEAGAALVKNVRDKRTKAAEHREVEDELRRTNEEIASQQEVLASVRAQLAAEDAAGQRTSVQRDLQIYDKERGSVVDRLRDRWLEVARAVQLLEMRSALDPLNPGELIRALEAVKAASEGLEPPDWPRDPGAMDKLVECAGEAALSRLPKAVDRRDEAIGYVRQLKEELADAVERLRQAKTGRVSLEPATLRFMDALREEGMAPRTLSEVAEVVDERWRLAIEALLIRDREAIIVDPEHARRATEMLRHGRQTFGTCRVANTRRLEGRSGISEKGTLASVLRSEDALAMAFVVYRVGNVRLAESQDELLAGGRAVMEDGAYNDGLVTDIRKALEFKIGRAAAPLMEAALERRIEDIRTFLNNHERNRSLYDDLIRRLEAIGREIAPQETVERITVDLAEIEEKRSAARRRLAGIAALIDPALLDAERRAEKMLEEFGADRDELMVRRGAVGAQLEVFEGRLGAGDSQVGSRLALAQRRRLFRDAVRSRGSLREIVPRYRALGGRAPGRIAAEMNRLAAESREAHRGLDREIRHALGEYAIHFPDPLEGYGSVAIVPVVLPWVEQGIQALEGNELIQYQRQADEAADRISRLFRTTFVHELNSRFRLLETEMDALGKALKARPLHGETYQLQPSVKQEFQDLYRLARDSEDDETTLDALFGRGEPRDERYGRALRQVEQLLGDETLDFSMYQDYRNYFSFDLKLKDVATGRVTSFDKRRGVASGAERQVPFYVVIGAALSSIYHGTRRMGVAGELGMGLAVFDEAFSKMDGPNQRTLLEFYRDIGLQVVIAAPTEKRAVIYENLDCIIDVFRSGDVAVAESLRIKQRARDAMRSANPQHLTDPELAERLGADARAAE